MNLFTELVKRRVFATGAIYIPAAWLAAEILLAIFDRFDAPAWAGDIVVVLFLLGFALNDWSLWCLAALLVVAISLHLLVLIEEEHLRRVFGEKYVEFCSKTPRYIGWAKS